MSLWTLLLALMCSHVETAGAMAQLLKMFLYATAATSHFFLSWSVFPSEQRLWSLVEFINAEDCYLTSYLCRSHVSCCGRAYRNIMMYLGWFIAFNPNPNSRSLFTIIGLCYWLENIFSCLPQHQEYLGIPLILWHALILRATLKTPHKTVWPPLNCKVDIMQSNKYHFPGIHQAKTHLSVWKSTKSDLLTQ